MPKTKTMSPSIKKRDKVVYTDNLLVTEKENIKA